MTKRNQKNPKNLIDENQLVGRKQLKKTPSKKGKSKNTENDAENADHNPTSENITKITKNKSDEIEVEQKHNQTPQPPHVPPHVLPHVPHHQPTNDTMETTSINDEQPRVPPVRQKQYYDEDKEDSLSYLIDVLPYIDTDYTTEDQERVNKLIESEKRIFPPTKNYLEHLPAPELNFSGSLFLKEELSRISRKEGMQTMDTFRYEVPPPPASKQNDLNAWLIAVNNSKAQLQHQNLRIVNLDLLNRFGPNAWRANLQNLENIQRMEAKAIEQKKKEIEELNRQRKSEQLNAATKLKQMENRWLELVNKNVDIEIACINLEKEIENMKLAAGLNQSTTDTPMEQSITQ